MSAVVENFYKIEQKIAQVHKKQLLPEEKLPQIIVVAKHHPADAIAPLLKMGHRSFGENKVQEAREKWTVLKREYPETELHLIGGLQTNKVKEALQIFDVIHTVDREKLAKKICTESEGLTIKPRLFVQVNVGEELQKSGVMLNEADDFIHFCRNELALNVEGLMCIPPVDEPSGLYFGLLNQMVEKHGLSQLSMGMSSDYETAVAMGATHIRVGTAIMGKLPL